MPLKDVLRDLNQEKVRCVELICPLVNMAHDASMDTALR
jgi:hypothetical protein